MDSKLGNSYVALKSYLALDEKRIVIAGAGVTGLSVANALIKKGAHIVFADEKIDSVEAFEVRKPNEINPADFDAIMVSPGWRDDHPLILLARSHEKEILNEIDFAWSVKNEQAPHQKWIALTGTNGKTTTVEMAAHILSTAGVKATACGNVGKTVIDSVLSSDNYDYLILELSSFQLHWIEDAQFISSAILNIAEDHVDWHGTFDSYARDKISILDRSTTAILNGDDGEVVGRTAHWLGRKIFYSLDTPEPGELGLVEELLVDRAFVADAQEAGLFAELNEITPSVPHQVSNALAAAGLCATIGISHADIRKGLSTFTPGRHRIEEVCVRNGVKWIDDSKATNPHAAAASILSNFSVIWIAGGLAKGASMEPLIERVWSRLKAAILIGEDRHLIVDQLKVKAPHLPLILIDTPAGYVRGGESNEFAESIVRSAKEIAKEGDVVLLAPACASMDQFLSYGDRGDRFQRAIQKVVINEH